VQQLAFPPAAQFNRVDSRLMGSVAWPFRTRAQQTDIGYDGQPAFAQSF
jgi:hypothetical protein